MTDTSFSGVAPGDPVEEAALYAVRGNVATLPINRPQSPDAVTRPLPTALGVGTGAAATDDPVRPAAGIGTGLVFCAGTGLEELAQGNQADAVEHPEWRFAGLVQYRIGKPVISAFRGFAMDGGADLGLVCEVPLRCAIEIALVGNPINVITHQESRFINRAIGDERVLDGAIELYEIVPTKAPQSVDHTKCTVGTARDGTSGGDVDLGDEGPWELNAESSDALLSGADGLEGARVRRQAPARLAGAPMPASAGQRLPAAHRVRESL
ncbi:enoyl-CoA hydratase-related protein [Streptomyces sp. NPDC090493]|uniref:enoyl-CoA hydratase-related protein n=1 Tax=Streptomyces sp. NPDC090493 TaxID=3365964 RepID=UPI0038052DED